MLTGLILEASGFVPNAEQPESAKLALLGLYAVFPMACYFLGATVLARFGLNEEEHARVRAALDARRRAG
jgi:Na+/melibiose symporter-like transporter